MGFLYDVFHLYEENRTTHSFITVIAFVIFPVAWIVPHLMWTRTNKRISKFLVPIKIFYSVSLGKFPVKLENQLIANFIIFRMSTKGRIWHIFSLFWDRKQYIASFNIPMLTWLLSIVTHDIYIKRRITDERFPHCIHTVWLFVPHRHVIYELRFLLWQHSWLS